MTEPADRLAGAFALMGPARVLLRRGGEMGPPSEAHVTGDAVVLGRGALSL